jgi:hypothetical protein
MSDPDYDFLNEEAPGEVVPEETVTTETPPETVAVTPEVPASVVPTATEPKEETVPLAALRAEREKRQRYERELAEIRQANVAPAPDFYEQPKQYIDSLLAQERQQMTAQHLGALEAMAREVYPDYDEVFNDVLEAAQVNPALQQQVMSSPNPAIAAYKLGKQLRELKAMQDPEAYRQRIEAEIRAKVDAEYRAKEEARQKAADAIPPDLTAARATRTDEVVPDDSLDSILQSRNKR